MRYSFSQRLQMSLTILLFLWCVLLSLPSLCGSVVEGNIISFAPHRKCAGVNASSVSCVMGLEFRAASMLTRVVANSSSVACDRPNTFLRHLFVVPIILSHHPPNQTALGAMNFHVLPYWATRRWVLVALLLSDIDTKAKMHRPLWSEIKAHGSYTHSHV